MANTYLGNPGFPHGRPELTGVLLVNLGTPTEPTPAAVRRYLAEFLWDPRVIEAPRWLWWLALHGLILRTRPARSARAYARIWGEHGSPLMALSRSLAGKVARQLDRDGTRPLAVRLAMRYGEPSIAHALDELRGSGLRRLLVVPLYPQYSATTTASVFDAVAAVLSRWRFVPELRFVQDYWRDDAHLDALAQSVRSHRQAQGAGSKLLFSFHGIPQRYFRAGDPYFCQCHGTARAVAGRLGLADDDWALSFQSRVGREEWLRPYTDEVLAAWPAQGVKSVDVVCPGFAVDCLETLEEIAIENRQRFLVAGGERCAYIPALNDGNAQVDALAALVRRHAHGWAPFDDAWSPARSEADVADRARKQRELAERTR
jgi:ferrochelatase